MYTYWDFSVRKYKKKVICIIADKYFTLMTPWGKSNERNNFSGHALLFLLMVRSL